jgi:uncharacterized protein YecT (DUF1311 family)
MKRMILILLLVASGSMANAGQPDKRLSAQFYTCMETADSYEAKGPCYSSEDAIQKKKLNAAYGRIARHADPADLAALDTAQKAWIAWRDETASYLGEHAGDVGSTNFVITEGYILKAIVEQTDLLNEIADSRGW